MALQPITILMRTITTKKVMSISRERNQKWVRLPQVEARYKKLKLKRKSRKQKKATLKTCMVRESSSKVLLT